MEENKQPIGVEAQCFSCGKVWNISLLPPDAKGVKCPSCNGFVITESGKAMVRYIFDEWLATSPLLEEGDWEKSLRDKILGNIDGN